MNFIVENLVKYLGPLVVKLLSDKLGDLFNQIVLFIGKELNKKHLENIDKKLDEARRLMDSNKLEDRRKAAKLYENLFNNL